MTVGDAAHCPATGQTATDPADAPIPRRSLSDEVLVALFAIAVEQLRREQLQAAIREGYERHMLVAGAA